MRYPARTIVFLASIDGIRRLHPLLALLKVNVIPLHSGMQQRQRLKALDKYVPPSVHYRDTAFRLTRSFVGSNLLRTASSLPPMLQHVDWTSPPCLTSCTTNSLDQRIPTSIGLVERLVLELLV